MNISRLAMTCALAAGVAGFATTAEAFCTDSRADVRTLCPHPVPYSGPKRLTPTSRGMPTVGTPGLYKNWGNGYDVRVYLGRNGTGYQDFPWAVQTDYGKTN